MSLPTDAPPRHLPAAATPPWPLQPPPHGASVPTIPVSPRTGGGGLSTLAIALIGGAAAAAVGLAIAVPLLLREPPKAKRKNSGKPRGKRRHDAGKGA